MKTRLSLFSILFLLINPIFSQDSLQKFRVITSINLGTTGVGGELKFPFKKESDPVMQTDAQFREQLYLRNLLKNS